MSDPTLAPNVEAAAPARRRTQGPIMAVLLLVVAAAGLVIWYGLNRETPTVVVQRFMSALKGERWEQAYQLIDWPEDKRVDEKTFVGMAKAVRGLYTIQKYKLGDFRREHDTAVVPVTVTISKTGLLGTDEVTSDVPMQCRYRNGEWKVKPDLSKLLGLGKIELPGLRG